MTALQTERFAPQLATGRPWADTLATHAFTGLLAAGCTTSALATSLCAAGTIAFTLNPLTIWPRWLLIYAPTLAAATYKLSRWTWRLAQTIRRRA